MSQESIELIIFRNVTNGNGEARLLEHQKRATYVHEMIETLELQVIEWGQLDAPTPHEDVQIIIDIAKTVEATGLAVAAIIHSIVLWMIVKKRLKEVEGAKIQTSGYTVTINRGSVSGLLNVLNNLQSEVPVSRRVKPSRRIHEVSTPPPFTIETIRHHSPE